MAPDAEPSRGLPPAVVERAATRVARVALVTAIALPAVQVARAAAQPALADATFNPANRLVLLAAVLWRRRRSSRRGNSAWRRRRWCFGWGWPGRC